MGVYPVIERYLGRLTREFASASSKHEAHQRSRPIIEELTHDPAFLTEAIRKHLATPASLNKKHYPVFSFDIDLNAYFGLVLNCWIPLPDASTNMSTKLVHHHGDMLLTTGTLFGPGYEHWTFEKPQPNPNGTYTLKHITHVVHPHHNVDFVDSYIAHCPFYPPSLTITAALWSSRFPTTWKDKVKRWPIFRGREATLRKLAATIGLAKSLELKIVQDFDFYPTPQGFRSITDRVEFELGPNDDHLQSFFHIVQKTGNTSLLPELKRAAEHVENRATYERLLKELESGKDIPGKLSAKHYGQPRLNFTRDELLAAVAAQEASTPVQAAR